MSSLDQIGVRVEARPEAAAATHNVAPVLHEIRHAVGQLIRTGESTTIDLSALPFAPSDEQDLRSALGRGETTAVVSVLGETRIEETAYAGVWLIDHLGPDGGRLALHIEVAEVPLLLKTPKEDLADALESLERALADGAPQST